MRNVHLFRVSYPTQYRQMELLPRDSINREGTKDSTPQPLGQENGVTTRMVEMGKPF